MDTKAFVGKTAIVTGAAHGIGRAIARELAMRGAQVWACDVVEDELRETKARCQEAAQAAWERQRLSGAPPVEPHGGCHTRKVDVGDPAAVNAFVAEVAAVADGVDILVNNAGGVVGQVGKPLENVTDAEWRAIFAVNLDGAFHMARAVAPHMKRRGYGRIVNISSGAGRSVSLTGIQAYASAKAGQIGLTRQLAHELGPFGITVNSVAPGFVISNPSTQAQYDAMGPEGQQRLIESISLRRLGTAEDIAYAVLFFASDYSRWVSGQVLSVDGGRALF